MELNPQLFDDTAINRICDGYREGSGDLDDDHFQILTSPFKVLKMKDLCLDMTFVRKLTDEVKALDLLRKNNDLYSLWQSLDLTHHEGGCISKFVQTLRQRIGKILSQIMNVKFNENFTITASLYKSGDVLLCHDDKCTDRCVAFVFYLTGTGEEEGGSFDMFEKDDKGQPTTVAKSLPAVANSFLCFEVGNYTYHQVSEIKDPTFERISLNGWFHSDRELTPLEYTDPMPPLLHQVVSPN
uniref:2-oxoglutarate and iron-dependent oxygenase domain-containing protein 1 n=1 Tax=Lygus hesperus TaxID=30085 RepID=A0A0A9WE59_LYGHE